MSRTYDASVSARAIGPFSVNAGWSQTQQNVTATPDASEIVDPGRPGRTLRAPRQHLGRRRVPSPSAASC